MLKIFDNSASCGSLIEYEEKWKDQNKRIKATWHELRQEIWDLRAEARVLMKPPPKKNFFDILKETLFDE